MVVKQYETHFKAQQSIRTSKKFKKLLNHYLPGDNIVEAIIEQTRLLKKEEADIIVKQWEENWMSGEWNEAIIKADETLEQQEYYPLVKIVLNYVRLFVHNDAKYATQDYVKAVMLQEHVGETFTKTHYETLTNPWLTGKRASQPHEWSYRNRQLHINTVTVDVQNVETTNVGAVKSNSNDFVNHMETTDLEFLTETVNNEETLVDSSETVEKFWNQEKLIPRSTQNNVEENKTGKTVETDNHVEGETVSVTTVGEKFAAENVKNEITDDTQDYIELPKSFETQNVVKTILNDLSAETKTVEQQHVGNTNKFETTINNVKDATFTAVKSVKNYLGYEIGTPVFEKNVEKFENEEKNVTHHVEKVEKETFVETEQETFVEKTEPLEKIENKIAEMPEHLQEFMKTIYSK